MGERFIYEMDKHGCDVVYDRETHSEYATCEVVAMLNERDRLFAEVRTLRELLVECRRRIVYADDSDLAKRIDAALADTEPTR